MLPDWKVKATTTMMSGHVFVDEFNYATDEFSMKDIISYVGMKSMNRGFKGTQDIDDIKVEIINYY